MSQSGSHGDIIGDESESGSRAIEIRQSGSRKRSFVWNHFDDVEENIVVCKKCETKFTFKPRSNTTHLRRHILEGCPNISKEERAMIVANLGKDLFETSTFRFDPDLTRSLLTLLFIDAKIPFSVINSRFWEPAMRSLRPEYRAVKRQTLRNDCVEVFKAGSNVALNEFAALDSRVCFTSDIWTSSTKLGYLCLTAHYIDHGFNLQKKIIAFKKMPYPHKGQAISDVIEQIFVHWKLDKKIFTLTLDNCSANDNAVSLLENKLWERTNFRGRFMHMRCTAHILNILVQDGMSIIQPTVKKIRELMRTIDSSPTKL